MIDSIIFLFAPEITPLNLTKSETKSSEQIIGLGRGGVKRFISRRV